jgi:NAD(P)H dehydrogenase (quinone)
LSKKYRDGSIDEMNVFLVLAHPEPKSFNSALYLIAQRFFQEQGHTVRTSDLYAMGFNPVSGRDNFTSIKDPDFFKPQTEEIYATDVGGFAPDIEKELQKLEWCDLMIWQFPLWWFGAPAILKGWADRTLAMGRTYGSGRFYETGVLKGKRALLSVTTGGPGTDYEKGGWNGDIHSILRPIQRGIFEFVGFSVLAPHIAFGPAHLTQDERSNELDRYLARLERIENEVPHNVGIY